MIGFMTAGWHEIGKKASLSMTTSKSMKTNTTTTMTAWNKALSLKENDLGYDCKNNHDKEVGVIAVTEESSLMSFESKSIVLSNNPNGSG